MAENYTFMDGPSTSGVAKPVHIQRLERAMDLRHVIMHTDKVLSSTLTSDDSSDDDEQIEVEDDTCDEAETDVSRYYNLESVDDGRLWLQGVLLDNSDESNDGNDEDMPFIKSLHSEVKGKRKSYYNNSENILNQYFGCGLLSNMDMYPENQVQRPVPIAKKLPIRKERKTDNRKSLKKGSFKQPMPYDDTEEANYLETEWENGVGGNDEFEDDYELRNGLPHTIDRKRNLAKTPEAMLARRKKVFTNMVKKELGKQQRAKINHHKEVLAQCKKAATLCARAVRQKALHSARVSKEQQWRIKRLSRENAAYWKRYNRVDREIRRRMEKEAEEQRKMDVEFIEAKRQQRKLNFLITQTELYAHFMSKKLGKASPEEQLRILNQLDEEKNPRLASMDDYDSDIMKAKAKKNAMEAFESERARTKNFDIDAKALSKEGEIGGDEEHQQPTIFQGNLKGYQLRGMNWLANLYDQGISGILADEMGLGKTVQSIAFLCHVAEKYSVWGPFLIISPASTLHNWQQEMERFVPHFKVVPYWGNPTERKILRQFWDQKDMHTKDASFHVVITSYQIVITDFKYFNRIKWQYMILDEAQAIKSTSSVRWKMLLGFSCRNRLLLSGTPIQNSMAELWALLHFIMPTLFDSHDEFNEWFSKDIESHAENKTGIDEKHLSRLHMILKPFMLRRIKKDVENELSDKIEVMVYCPLTTRQKFLYMVLKKKIRIEDLLHVGGGDSHSVDRNFTSNLMNLVMQFRKVCNHPELFERRDAKSPIYVKPFEYIVPQLVYDENFRMKTLLIIFKYFIFTSEIVHKMLAMGNVPTLFSFTRLLNVSPNELYKILQGDVLFRWIHYFETQRQDSILFHAESWKMDCGLGNKNRFSRNVNKRWLLNLIPYFKLSDASINCSNVLANFIFAKNNSGNRVIYTHTMHVYNSMPETLEHRTIRSKAIGVADDYNINKIDIKSQSGLAQSINTASNSKDLGSVPLLKEILYVERKQQRFKCTPTQLPKFLFSCGPKLEARYPKLYCATRGAQWHWMRHLDSNSWQSLQLHWVQATNTISYRDIPYRIQPIPTNGLERLVPTNGWSNIMIPDKETLVTDAGKLSVLDNLLKRLKEEGHRVLIYSQMTKMIDLLEEYMWHRKHKYMRLDGSSKISERRDMVADFQARTDIFVFLLSTRAGGLGINLTAADTVIFYDSDWNPTVDQQAMDRAHRLGQTKQVTVYRLICKGSIEERILQRAREKSEIQRMVISGGNFKPDTLKPKEVVSLLLDDEEIEMKYRQRTEERKHVEEAREREKDRERKRKQVMTVKPMSGLETKKIRLDGYPQEVGNEDNWLNVDSGPNSPVRSETSPEADEDGLVVDMDYNLGNSNVPFVSPYSATSRPRVPGRGLSKRGRPRGSRRSVLSRNYVSNTNFSQSSTDVSGMTANDPSLPSSSSTADLSASGPATSANATYGGVSGGGSSGRRGPGRPRLKPGGPPNQGSRGTYRPRKPARPLPVPIHGSGTSSITTNVKGYPNVSTYYFEIKDHADS